MQKVFLNYNQVLYPEGLPGCKLEGICAQAEPALYHAAGEDIPSFVFAARRASFNS